MKHTRRGFVGVLGLGVATAALPESDAAPTLALGDRAHILARPQSKQRLIDCLTGVLGCAAPQALAVPGRAEPILAFSFPSGGSLSVEFTSDALDEKDARRGAWLELRASDPAALKKRVLDAGLERVHYLAPSRFYFVVPGGQVFGIVSAT